MSRLVCDACNAKPCRCLPYAELRMRAVETSLRKSERLLVVLTVAVDAMSSLLDAGDRATCESIIRERLTELIGAKAAEHHAATGDPFHGLK